MERAEWLEDKGSIARQAPYRSRRRFIRDQYSGERPPLKLVKNEPLTRRDYDGLQSSAN
jgi:hypothetical protein